MAKQSRGQVAKQSTSGIEGFAGSDREAVAPVDDGQKRAAGLEQGRSPSNDKPSVGDDLGDASELQIAKGGDEPSSVSAASVSQNVFRGVSANSFAIPGLHAADDAPPLPAGSFSVANVGGSNDLKQIANTQQYPFRAICSLEMTGTNGKRAIGTGWFAGPNLIVTAGHNLCHNDIIGGGWVAQVNVWPGRDGNSTPYSETAVTSQLGVSNSWLNQDANSQQLDFGVIRLTQGLGNKVGWFGLTPWPASQLTGNQFNVVGYPQETARIPAWTMWYDIGSIAFVGQLTLQYRMDTTPGDSGSPVIAWVDDRTEKGSMLAVGIHNYGLSNGLNEATRITPSVIKTIQALSS